MQYKPFGMGKKLRCNVFDHPQQVYIANQTPRQESLNTNEHFFPKFYTCINFNPPMNPVKFRQDQIQNGQLIAILFAQIDKIFENFVPSG